MEGLEALLRRVITSRSERDNQILIGPSDMANTCDRCLGMALMNLKADGPHMPEDRFSLKAWVGTAVHERLERLINSHPVAGDLIDTEFSVPITVIEGYGKIVGHVDAFSPMHCQVLDFKTGDVAAIRSYRMAGTPKKSHVGQVNTYAYGLRRLGLYVSTVSLFYLPRDHNQISQAWFWTGDYDEAMAERVITRANRIYRDYVSRGRVELLKSERGCYICNRWSRVGSFVEAR